MDNTQLQYIKIQSQYANKLEQFEKCIVKAAKEAHSLADTAEKKCEQARAALESGDMEVMWNTIQQLFLGTDKIGHVFREFSYNV